MSLVRKISATIAAIFLMAALAAAQDTSAQQKRLRQLQKDIEVLDAQIATASKQAGDALTKLSLIRTKVSARRELVAESDKEIAECNRTISRQQSQIDKIQARVDTLSLYYSRLVRSAYKSRDTKNWYMYILASDNISQAFRRLSYFRSLSNELKDQAVKLSEARAELVIQQDRMKELKAGAVTLKKSREKELASLQAEEAEASRLASQLKKNKTKYVNELNAKRKEMEKVNREIEQLISSKSKGTSTKKAAPIDYTLDSEFSRNKGKLPWPALGPVVSGFGVNYHPDFANIKMPQNNGIDIALRKDATVSAVFDGTVCHVAVLPIYGQCVLVQHGGYFTFYCKLKSVGVKVGDKVRTGQTLALVDTINGATQLHFEVWKETTPQNPSGWLRPQ
ncbi:MAG: peptidoglycan DD-metalloendopeptidase family protein [Bacteroidales bacterium]|nr:peptidoglycan DD-metalloendopeptidase family protein [Bacteroidales bacterium]